MNKDHMYQELNACVNSHLTEKSNLYLTDKISSEDRILYHQLCRDSYEQSFIMQGLSERYHNTQMRRLDDVFNYVELGDNILPSIIRPVDTFDLLNPSQSSKVINGCYSILTEMFSHSRAVNCLKAIRRYCLYFKENSYIHKAGQKSLYLPSIYGHIDCPVNKYNIPQNKPSDAYKHYLTETEYKQFLSMLWRQWHEAKESNTISHQHQLFFICVVAGELGLRLQEILGLCSEHFYLKENICLVVNGKGSNGSGYRKREVPLTDFLKASLKDFLHVFPRHKGQNLFQNHEGKSLPQSTARRWLQIALKEAVNQSILLGIESGFGFHAFRRTYARSFMANGGEFMELMKNTGWKFASTAGCYIGTSKPTINYLGV